MFLNHCSDERIQEAVDALIRNMGYKLNEVFRDSVAGSIKERRRLEKAVAFAVKEKSPEVIVLTAHEDCAAGTTRDELSVALENFQEMYPQMLVRAYWMLLNGAVQEVQAENAKRKEGEPARRVSGGCRF